MITRYRRGRHVANQFSVRVQDIKDDLHEERYRAVMAARQDEPQKTSPWPVVIHEGREYWEVQCVFWPDGDFEGETAYIAIAPSTSSDVIGIVEPVQLEEAAWMKQASGSA